MATLLNRPSQDVHTTDRLFATTRQRVWDIPDESMHQVFKDYILSPEPFSL